MATSIKDANTEVVRDPHSGGNSSVKIMDQPPGHKSLSADVLNRLGNRLSGNPMPGFDVSAVPPSSMMV